MGVLIYRRYLSCIKDRGIHKAAAKVKKALKEDPEHTTYCLKMDIVKFYPSIDHDILKTILRKTKIKICFGCLT